MDGVMFYTTGLVGQNQGQRCLEKFAIWSYQFPIGRQTTTVFGWASLSECGTGANSAIYDCLVELWNMIVFRKC